MTSDQLTFVMRYGKTALQVAGTLLAYWICWFLVSRAVSTLMRKSRLDETVGSFLLLAAKYIFGGLALLAALGLFGIDTKSLLAGLGVVGLGVGLASKDTLANIIAGLFILWDRPFVLNDLIEVGGKYGRVEHITLRTTRVVTVDGKMLSIPNSVIVNSTVASYTNYPHLRLDIEVTIGVIESIQRTREILLALVKGDVRFRSDPPAAVLVTGLNPYNVAVQLQVWIDNERDHIPLRAMLTEKAFESLRSAGIDMPFPTTRVYSSSEPLYREPEVAQKKELTS